MDCETLENTPMTASELRIGNYITRLLDGRPLEEEKCTIRTLWEVFQRENGGNSELTKFTFESIPLTEEWLERFGFKSETYKDGYIGIDVKLSRSNMTTQFVLSKPRQAVDTCEYFHWNFSQGRWPMYNEFRYVHELQNFFFALTGSELELKN